MIGGLDMAYFLGNRQYGVLQPIDLVNEKGEKIPDKLLDILRFTTSFETEQDLKDYLMEKFLVDNFSAKLCYLISKGPKNNRRYEIIRLGDTVYLSSTAKYLSPSYLKKYVQDNKFNADFLSHLLGFYLKKFGLLNIAIKRFSGIYYKHDDFCVLLDSMLNYNFSDNLKEHLSKIRDFINDPKTKDIYGNITLTEAENIYFEGLLNSTNYVISQDDDDVRRFVNFFRTRCRFPVVPTIQILEKISSMCHYISTVGADAIEGYDEGENIQSLCESFIASVLYTYDSTTNDYKKQNGEYKVNERNLCDLAMFVSNYEEYTNRIVATLNPLTSNVPSNDTYEEEEDEKEEFLDESDFARYGTSSVEQGCRLRYGDGDKQW